MAAADVCGLNTEALRRGYSINKEISPLSSVNLDLCRTTPAFEIPPNFDVG